MRPAGNVLPNPAFKGAARGARAHTHARTRSHTRTQTHTQACTEREREKRLTPRLSTLQFPSSQLKNAAASCGSSAPPSCPPMPSVTAHATSSQARTHVGCWCARARRHALARTSARTRARSHARARARQLICTHAK
eukprot:1410961-Pleurochrysis_carterae.AAC.1